MSRAHQAPNRREWRRSLIWAALFAFLPLALFTYWFGIADRSSVFLYDHVAPGIARAQPFDALTSSRYWMAGLVATGIVFVLESGWMTWQGWRVARRGRTYRSPSWRQIWLLAALPVNVSIPVIVMTLNHPTLPPSLAAACVFATLAGLALALAVGDRASDLPRFACLMLDGLGLVPMLLLLPALELPGEGLISWALAIPVAAGGVLVSIAWLVIVSTLARRRNHPLGAPDVLAAGLCWSYLLMPLAHYILATPYPYKYITAASNVFANNGLLQVVIFFIASSVTVVTHHTGVNSSRPFVENKL